MNRDLSKGSVVKSMLLFAIPMILGDLLQQCYNIADTIIVGQLLGEKALAAVGSSFTLMTFITSIILGLCIGSGVLFSIRFGQRDENGLKEDICASFLFITAVTILLNIIAYISLSGLRTFLRVPEEVWGDMREYLFIIFMGIPAVFLYNYFASYLRAIGNSVIPLLFLAVSSILNIILDLWFVIGLKLGVAGAAKATVISQYLSGIGIMVYTLMRYKQVCAIWKIRYLKKERIGEIISFSMLTCIQQSVMNLGILMVQGLVNSFGTVVMAAFAAAVKIDAFAYMRAGLWKRIFYIYCTKLWSKREEENTAGAKSGGSYICNFLCSGINVCVYILKTTYDDICGCKRNGYYNGRSPLLAHRRCILYWNRMAVFAVWSVSCFGQTGNECGTYSIFTWNTSGVGIYIVCNTGNRCGWHLVVNSNRMGAGRYCGTVVL